MGVSFAFFGADAACRPVFDDLEPYFSVVEVRTPDFGVFHYELGERVMRVLLEAEAPDDELVLEVADPEARTFHCLAAYSSRGRAQSALSRFVLTQTQDSAEQSGYVGIHASCVRVADRGIVIAGQKRSGKTAVMVALLSECGGAFVSNDRTSVSSHLVAHGWPEAVGLRPWHTAASPPLEAYLRTAALATRQSAQKGRKLELSPRAFCGLLGCEVRESSSIAAMLLPEYGETARGLETEILAPRDAWETLRGLGLGGVGAAEGRGVSGAQCAGERVLREFCHQVPVIRMRYSDRTLRESCPALVDLLLGLPSGEGRVEA